MFVSNIDEVEREGATTQCGAAIHDHLLIAGQPLLYTSSLQNAINRQGLTRCASCAKHFALQDCCVEAWNASKCSWNNIHPVCDTVLLRTNQTGTFRINRSNQC